MAAEELIEIKFRLADGTDIEKTGLNDLKLINVGKILENNKTLAKSRSPVSEVPGGAITMLVVGMFFLFVKTILFILRVFKFIMTMFFHYCIVFLLSDEPYPTRTVEPTRIFFYVRTNNIETFKKVNPLEKIPGSATGSLYMSVGKFSQYHIILYTIKYAILSHQPTLAPQLWY
ncbi:putative Ubiquitin-like domain superfamily, UBL3-like, ubiquitin domain-containing protein [Helianthus annuus]|nr:putative Ubiquitin-like domain superfamily, UBL3-like, ubiquitin domain-containing protein [Helianthus annuus]KAJ0554673.1 putative Ubiquitin-like domain superfamily, UBL3-like, ubiquitin domain-containing protein [Helianthus annuus]KAJ0720235.1 putative Ubiquitin-like domain superfamily, UBL3-like, ubiquitin domain-containing protein [Helianthus annuus]KAJ0723454.1 putative Ubiquitin-like domain superfamily, UBL3-like, ubiquitin domain-containing protein [Helianthus annuus]KAJ0899242.1 puta